MLKKSIAYQFSLFSAFQNCFFTLSQFSEDNTFVGFAASTLMLNEQLKSQLNKEAAKFLFSLHKQFPKQCPKSPVFLDKTSGQLQQLSKYKNFIIYPMTGGTEKIVIDSLKHCNKDSSIVLFHNELNNSLASSLEIKYNLSKIAKVKLTNNIEQIEKLLNEVKKNLLDKDVDLIQSQTKLQKINFNLGLIGNISPWLINEHIDEIQSSTIILGCNIKQFGISELKSLVNEIPNSLADNYFQTISKKFCFKTCNPKINLQDQLISSKIYLALEQIYTKNKLDGLTIGCFDIISKDQLNGTACMALGILNSQQYCCSCEGELSSLIGMIIAKKYFQKNSFMANIIHYYIEKSTQYILLAHCTSPFCFSVLDEKQDLTQLEQIMHTELDSHFETDLGIALRVQLASQKNNTNFSLLKLRGNQAIVLDVELVRSLASESMCRTQLLVKLNNSKNLENFIEKSLGNHHLLINVKPDLLKQQLIQLGFKIINL